MFNCIFCNREKIKKDILYEDDDFFIKVGFGLITAGHIMIISKKHFDCFASMPKELWDKFEKLKEKITGKIEVSFAEPFLIECGNPGSIDHAHIHLIPLIGAGYRVDSIMEEMVKDYPYNKVDSARIKDFYIQNNRYVLVGEKRKYYFCVVEGEGRVIDIRIDYRSFFAKKGISGVQNWKNLSTEEKKVDEEKRRITRTTLQF